MPESEFAYTRAPTGHRMHANAILGAVHLQVADLARSVAYYETVIGLRAISADAAHAVLGVHGDPTPLVVLHHREGATPVPSRGRLGLYHFAILLPDRAALGRFIAHLAAIGAYAGMSDHLVSEAVYLTDPDGLGIEVYADRPRNAWRVANRTLEMATLTLDAADLVRASRGVPWSGAPAGTRIGHVHLFVSDLDAAARFYHDGLGLDKVLLDFPGALFMSAGGYHHHLGTNTWAAGAPSAQPEDARMLEWSVILPSAADVEATAHALERAGATISRTDGDVVAADPWGTIVRVTATTP
ncbi:MAG: VOC family protein [Gemmatimonadaceae bacterium]|nr:VOC family protein [Gemmatimonadaceae bacterium]